MANKRKPTEVEGRIQTLEDEVKHLRSAVASLKEKYACIDANAARAVIEAAQKDAKHLHERLCVMIDKVTIATELTRMKPRKARAIIRAFDLPDKWWGAQARKNLGQLDAVKEFADEAL